jgi:hypothetical protein
VAGHLRRAGIDLVEDLGPVAFTEPHTITFGDARTWSADQIIQDDLGVAVSLFEAGPTLVPAADLTVAAELGRAFRALEMNVHTGTLVESLRAGGDAIPVDYRSGPFTGQLTVDAVFFTVGWPANVSHLALGAAGVRTEPGVVPVDDYLRTSAGHIFAAGDVNGRSMLVQSARMDGRIAATNAVLGPTRQATYEVVPSRSFTDPADRRGLHGRRDDHRAGRRAPARVPDLHRGRQHGRAEDLPVPGHRKLPAGLELSRRRRLTAIGPTREQQRPTKASADFLYLTKTYPIHPSRCAAPRGICWRHRAD